MWQTCSNNRGCCIGGLPSENYYAQRITNLGCEGISAYFKFGQIRTTSLKHFLFRQHYWIRQHYVRPTRWCLPSSCFSWRWHYTLRSFVQHSESWMKFSVGNVCQTSQTCLGCHTSRPSWRRSCDGPLQLLSVGTSETYIEHKLYWTSSRGTASVDGRWRVYIAYIPSGVITVYNGGHNYNNRRG